MSVVIPTYNSAAYIRDALESVFAQTYRDYEVLVVDSSFDETPVILASYGDRLRSVRQPPRGVAAARNVGLQQAQGTLVAFLDGDDVWEPGFLAQQVGVLERHPEAVLAFTDFRKTGQVQRSDGGRPMRRRGPFQAWVQAHGTTDPLVCVGKLHSVLLWGNVLPTSSVVLRREAAMAVGTFDEQFQVAEDYDYWLRLSLRFPMVYTCQALAAYRMHETGLSGPFTSRARRFITAHLRILEKHRLEAEARLTDEERRLIRKRIAALHYRLGTKNLEEADAIAALREIGRALRTVRTVGLEFADERSSWLQRSWLVLKPYVVWLISGVRILWPVMKP